MINAKTENAKAVHTRTKCFVYETGEPFSSKSPWEGRQTLKVVLLAHHANTRALTHAQLYNVDDIATNIFKAKVKVK